MMIKKKNSTSESYAKFRSWYEDFVEEHKGNCLGRAWFDDVQEKHSDLRSSLDALDLELEIEFKNGNKKISEQDFSDIKSQLQHLTPNIESDLKEFYKLSLGDLRLPLVTLDKSKHRFVQTTKFLTKFFQDYYDSKRIKAAPIISQLGQFYKKYSTQDGTIKVVLTTRAENFVKLGHYGPDNESCFKCGGGSESNKYKLGLLDNSFVLLFYSGDKLIGRMWGCFTDGLSIMNVVNPYLEKGVHEGNIRESCKILYSVIHNIKEDDVIATDDMFDPDSDAGIYLNEYGSMSLSKEKIKEMQVPWIDTPDYIRDYFEDE